MVTNNRSKTSEGVTSSQTQACYRKIRVMFGKKQILKCSFYISSYMSLRKLVVQKQFCILILVLVTCFTQILKIRVLETKKGKKVNLTIIIPNLLF